jgi:hypothetical protein
MTPAERQQVRAQVVASRRRQGHADSVQDAALYARLAAKLVFSALNDTSGPAVGHDAAILRHQGREGGPAASANGAASRRSGPQT